MSWIKITDKKPECSTRYDVWVVRKDSGFGWRETDILYSSGSFSMTVHPEHEVTHYMEKPEPPIVA